MLIIVHEVMPCFIECIRHKKNVFRNSTDMIASPSFITVAHKSLIMLFSFHLRLKYWIHDLQKRYDHSTKMRLYDPNDHAYKTNFQKLVHLADLVDKCMGHFRDGVARLSQRYYYAWRVTKAQNFLKQLLSDKFFETYLPTFTTQPFSSEMLSQLEQLFEVSLSKVEQSKNQYKMEKRRKLNDSKAQAKQQDDDVSMEEELENNVNSFINGNVNLRKHENSVSSTGSTTSDSEYKPNDQVDTIWLQMMNMKNNEDPISRINDPAMNLMYGATPSFLSQMDSDNAGGVPFSPGVLGGLGGTSFSSTGVSVGAGGQGGATGGYNSFELNHGEMFENFPIDELFKDFL